MGIGGISQRLTTTGIQQGDMMSAIANSVPKPEGFDRYVRKFRSLCAMHGVQIGSRTELSGFLQKLLEDIRQRRIDVVVVYKVDRLTRSLADFAKLVELFDSHEVSFVSVTQAFNTTTSMGRLTLNVLLSFAQFEREVTGERIRDKIAASKARGMWMGGVVPLGYDVRDRKLVVVDSVEGDLLAVVRGLPDPRRVDVFTPLGSKPETLPAGAVADTAPARVRGGSETILVVEDDPLVRSNVVMQLASLGVGDLIVGHTDRLPVTAVLPVQPHHRVCRGAGPGKEIQDDGIWLVAHEEPHRVFHSVERLRKGELPTRNEEFKEA